MPTNTFGPSNIFLTVIFPEDVVFSVPGKFVGLCSNHGKHFFSAVNVSLRHHKIGGSRYIGIWENESMKELRLLYFEVLRKLA